MISRPIWAPAASLALLTLLLCGHVLADFLVAPDRTVGARPRLARHAAAVLVTHLLVLGPMLSAGVALLTLCLALLHVGIDWLETRSRPATTAPLLPFARDQTVHFGVIIFAWCVFVAVSAAPLPTWLPSGVATAWIDAAILAAAFAFNATGGSTIVEGVLALLRREDSDDAGLPTGHLGAGRLIGILERTIMLVLVVYGELGAIALLITAKSIARFEEIKVRRFAEYYLIGTLTSLLVALGVGVLLRALLAF